VPNNYYGLEYPMLPDGLGHLFQGGLVELAAGLVRVRDYILDEQFLYPLDIVF
jgi:hypothetical protein